MQEQELAVLQGYKSLYDTNELYCQYPLWPPLFL